MSLNMMLTDQLAPAGLAPLPASFLGFPCGFGLGTFVHETSSGRRLCGWSGLAGTHVCFEPDSGYYVIVVKQTFPFNWGVQAQMVAEWPSDPG